MNSQAVDSQSPSKADDPFLKELSKLQGDTPTKSNGFSSNTTTPLSFLDPNDGVPSEKDTPNASKKLESLQQEVHQEGDNTAKGTVATLNDADAKDIPQVEKKVLDDAPAEGTPQTKVFHTKSAECQELIDMIERNGWENLDKLPMTNSCPELKDFVTRTGFSRSQIRRKYSAYMQELREKNKKRGSSYECPIEPDLDPDPNQENTVQVESTAGRKRGNNSEDFSAAFDTEGNTPGDLPPLDLKNPGVAQLPPFKRTRTFQSIFRQQTAPSNEDSEISPLPIGSSMNDKLYDDFEPTPVSSVQGPPTFGRFSSGVPPAPPLRGDVQTRELASMLLASMQGQPEVDALGGGLQDPYSPTPFAGYGNPSNIHTNYSEGAQVLLNHIQRVSCTPPQTFSSAVGFVTPSLTPNLTPFSSTDHGPFAVYHGLGSQDNLIPQVSTSSTTMSHHHPVEAATNMAPHSNANDSAFMGENLGWQLQQVLQQPSEQQQSPQDSMTFYKSYF